MSFEIMASLLVTNGLVAITALMFFFIIFKYCSFLRIIIKTLPRDMKGIYAKITAQLACKYHLRYNSTVPKIFDETAAKFPDKVCIYFEDEKWTFRDVQKYANRVANYFYKQGYKKGDGVALVMSNRPEYFPIWLGLSKIGVVTSLINTNLRQDCLIHALNALPHRGVIFENEFCREAMKEAMSLGYKPAACGLYSGINTANAPLLEDSIDLDAGLMAVSSTADTFNLPDPIGFHDPLMCIFTSGTTGFPKAAIIKHSRFFMFGILGQYLLGVRPSDTQYACLPMYHAGGGIFSFSSAVFMGTPIALRKKFSASNFWKDCARYNATVVLYVGEITRYIYAQPPSQYDRKHPIRLMIGIGLRKDLWADFSNRFGISDIKELYGATEGNCTMVGFDGKPGTCGFFPVWIPYSSLLNKLVKVTKEGEIVKDPVTGIALPCEIGEPGEMIGKIIPGDPFRDFKGYADKEASEQKIIRDVFCKGDAYFRSGDLLVMDKEGYLYFRDRCGDTFRWKGENVSTQELEFVISKMCDLKDVAVYGVQVPGAIDGKPGMAALADPGYKVDLKELSRNIVKKLPKYAIPLFLRVTNKDLELTGTFKIKKVDLRNEGYNIHTIKDPIYFFNGDEYMPLTEDLYNSIQTGKLCL